MTYVRLFLQIFLTIVVTLAVLSCSAWVAYQFRPIGLIVWFIAMFSLYLVLAFSLFDIKAPR